MYMEHYLSASQTQLEAQSIKSTIIRQISFWLWDRKLSREYNAIMKHRKARSFQEGDFSCLS